MSTLKTHHVYSTLKRRENERLHVLSTWNTRGVSVGRLIFNLEKTSMNQTVAVKDLLYFKEVLQVRQSKYLHSSWHVNPHHAKNVRIRVRENPYTGIFFVSTIKYYAALLKTYYKRWFWSIVGIFLASYLAYKLLRLQFLQKQEMW